MDKNEQIAISISLVRDDETKKVTFYVHKKCDIKELSAVFNCMYYQKADILNGDCNAYVIAATDRCVAYRIQNDVYIVPATIKAVVNNGDNKMHLWFDYPVDMDRKDLVKY